MQHGHMEQVGYDTYCKILDEKIKESKGIEVKEELDVTIDINVSSYIPDDYIENNSQKIEVYQNIALCRTKEDIDNTITDIEDRFGKMPKEMISLIGIAEIKEMCKNVGIIKVMQRQNNIVFFIQQEVFDMDIGELVHKYEDRIKISSGVNPYITYRLKNTANVIGEVKEFLDGYNK